MKAPEKNWLTAYALGELHDPHRRSLVEEWLAEHPEDMEELEAFALLGQSLEDAFRNEPMPKAMGTPSQKAEPSTREKTPAGYPGFIWGLGLAACFLLMLGALFFLQQEDEESVFVTQVDNVPMYRRVDQLQLTSAEDGVTGFEGLRNWPRIGFKQAGETLFALEDFLERAHIPSFGGEVWGDWLNFFSGRQVDVSNQQELISVRMERGVSPIDPGKQVVKMAVQARPAVWDDRPPSNLVIILDNSATMENQGRMALAKTAVARLLKHLDDRDRVALIQSVGDSPLVQRSMGMGMRATILDKLGGIETDYRNSSIAVWDEAFRQARRYYVPHGNNQIVLLTDGGLFHDGSNGMSLEAMQVLCRDRGIRISAFGLGMLQHPQSLISQLASDGGGVFGFLDESNQVDSLFVERLSDSLNPLAHGLRVQLLGDDAAKSACEVLGSSDAVEYGVLAQGDWVQAGDLWTGMLEVNGFEGSEFQAEGPGQALRLRVAYQLDFEEEERVLEYDIPILGDGLEATSEDFKFSMALASFADWVDQGELKQKADLETIIRYTEGVLHDSEDLYQLGFLKSLKLIESRMDS